MNKVYLVYLISDYGEYSGATGEVVYVADSKDTATRLANNYIREHLKCEDWKDKSYKEFYDRVDVNDTYSIIISEEPLYNECDIKKEKEDE